MAARKAGETIKPTSKGSQTPIGGRPARLSECWNRIQELLPAMKALEGEVSAVRGEMVSQVQEMRDELSAVALSAGVDPATAVQMSGELGETLGAVIRALRGQSAQFGFALEAEIEAGKRGKR